MPKKINPTTLIRIGERQHYKLKVHAAKKRMSMLGIINQLIDSLGNK